MEKEPMITTLIKFLFYVSLTSLAYACIQTANAMNKSSGRCMHISLIMVIVGLVALTFSVHYGFSINWVLVSIMPMVAGFSLWLIVGSAEVHHKIDKFISQLKTSFMARVLRRQK